MERSRRGSPKKPQETPAAARVIFVDDDPAMLRLLAEVAQSLHLASEGYDSADTFLQAFQPTGPACVVLDVRMPGMSGMELQRHLAALDETVPIIFVTAHADVRMAVEAMESGAFAFLEKPWRIQELCDKIQAAVRAAQENWQHRERRDNARQRLSTLTPAERTVLDLAVAGKINKVIAEELQLSVRTVEVHRARITAKLGTGALVDLLRLIQTAQEEAK